MTAQRAMTEAELQRAIADAARLGGWLCYHTHDSRHSAAGFPDLVLVRPPVTIFAELKGEHGHLTDEQHRWLDALHEAGQYAVIWRPADLDRVVTMLTQRGDRS